MQGKPRRRKLPILRVASARCVWRSRNWLNPSPSDLECDPNGRELHTLGPASRIVWGKDDPNHRRWQAPVRGQKEDEWDAWSTSQLILPKTTGSSKQGDTCMMTEV